MVVDVVVIHFKRTRYSQKHIGVHIAIGAGGSGNKVTLTTFLFQCYIFYISFVVFMHADLSILWQVLDWSIGLTCTAWSSAANAPKAGTEEQSRAVWRWAAYSTPN